MKKLIIAIAILCAVGGTLRGSSHLAAQSIPVSQVTFGTVADLRLQAGTANTQVLLNGLTSINDGNGGTYMWNATSTATDDGFITVAVTGVSTGRWIRIGNGNTIKGSITTSGISLTTAYALNYPGGTLPFVPITVVVIPRTVAAAGPSWVSGITNTGFTVNFVLAPTIGVNNLTFDYIVIKQ